MEFIIIGIDGDRMQISYHMHFFYTPVLVGVQSCIPTRSIFPFGFSLPIKASTHMYKQVSMGYKPCTCVLIVSEKECVCVFDKWFA